MNDTPFKWDFLTDTFFKDLKLKAGQFLESFLSVDPDRIGECKNCGRCCQLACKCVFYRDERCIIYKWRPLQCRKSPRTAKYLKEGCEGYSFFK